MKRSLIRYDFVTFVCLLLVGVWWRLALAEAYWINPDEGIYILSSARERFADIVQAGVAHAHPPLFYVVLGILQKLGLHNPVTLRCLSIGAWVCGAGILAAYGVFCSMSVRAILH
jgi:hypothetical protein